MQTYQTIINRGGIPTVESTDVTLTTGTSLVYTFRNNALRNAPFRGLLLVKLQAPPTGGTTEPVLFDNVNLTSVGGDNVTAADLAGAGIYLCYYEKGVALQILSGVV